MSTFSTPPAWQTPVLWPQVAERPRASPLGITTLTVLKAGIVAAVMSLTVLDRFGLRLHGEISLAMGLIGMYGLAAAMVVTRSAEVNVRGALGYVGVATVAALSFVVNKAFAPPAYVSVTSLLLLLVVFAPLCLSVRRDAVSPELWRWTLDLYVTFALLVAAAGIAQYFAQFTFSAMWLFDYTYLIPDRIQTSGHWATVHNMGLWIKSNGFFMREPSFFSMVMALGIVCELCLARRKWVIAVLAMGLLLSYSGSGLLLLGTALLFPLGVNTVLRVIGVALLATGLFVVLQESLNLAYTVNRMNEFTSTHSSAYCRFVYPAANAIEQINSSPWTGALGHGPGSIYRMRATCPNGFETAFSKALFEYGLLGSAAFVVMMLGALNRSGAPVRIRAGSAVMWLLLAGLLSGETLLFIYLVSAMWPQGLAAEAVASATRMRTAATT